MFCTVSNVEVFPGKFVFENVGNKYESILCKDFE